MGNIQNVINSKLKSIATSMSEFHIMTPDELQRETNIPAETWYEFINNNEDIRQFISRRINEDIEFAHRRSLAALSKEAQRGNVQAIKELNNLSGILNQNNNKQIVTHYIPRPTTKEEPDK